MSETKDGRADAGPERGLAISTTRPNGEAETYTLPAAAITRFVADTLNGAAKAARDNPLARGADLTPESQSMVTYPLRVGLSNALEHPTLVVDFGDAKVNIGIDKPTLKHLLERLDTLYPG